MVGGNFWPPTGSIFYFLPFFFIYHPLPILALPACLTTLAPQNHEQRPIKLQNKKTDPANEINDAVVQQRETKENIATMSDAWDDSDDEWDKSDDELDKRLGLVKVGDDPSAPAPTPAFVDEDEDEDLTLKDKELDERAALKLNKAKGSALADKKAAELAAREELELARKAMEMEAEMEANMTPEERRQAAREREEDDARAMADDLFGGVDDPGSKGPSGGPGQAMMSGDKVVMKDLKDHLRHAKKVGECIQVSSTFRL